jgi:hypothetical protein
MPLLLLPIKVLLGRTVLGCREEGLGWERGQPGLRRVLNARRRKRPPLSALKLVALEKGCSSCSIAGVIVVAQLKVHVAVRPRVLRRRRHSAHGEEAGRHWKSVGTVGHGHPEKRVVARNGSCRREQVMMVGG